MLNSSLPAVYAVAAACMLVTVLFIQRLFSLREGDFEYDHWLSWPPRNLIVNQLRASQSITDSMGPFAQMFKTKKIVHIPKYAEENGFLSRAYHWDYSHHNDSKALWVFMLLVAPVVLLLLNKQPVLVSFSQNVYSNFLLLSITAVLITLGVNYQRLAYWGYDILKPIDRKAYMMQQGLVLSISLFSYWALLVVCLAILPNVIVQPDLLCTAKFWSYLALTLNFSFLAFSWLAILSCLRSPAAVLVLGAVMCVILVAYFYYSGQLTLVHMIASNVVLVVINIIAWFKAYELWCANEFESK